MCDIEWTLIILVGMGLATTVAIMWLAFRG